MTRIRLLVALGLALLAYLTLPTAVFADGAPDLPSGGADGTVFTISAPIVTMIAALVIPLLNGLLTKATWSSWVKGLVTLILNGAVALFTTGRLADGTAVFGEQMLFTWSLGFLISIASYAGIYKPAKLTSSIVDVNGVEVDGRLANHGIK